MSKYTLPRFARALLLMSHIITAAMWLSVGIGLGLHEYGLSLVVAVFAVMTTRQDWLKRVSLEERTP